MKEQEKQKEKKKKEKRKYSRIGCIWWAIKNIWRIERRFCLFFLAALPISLVLPLANSYYPKVLLDSLAKETPFKELAVTILLYTVLLLILQILHSFFVCKQGSRHFWIAQEYQLEMMIKRSTTDYANTELQDFSQKYEYAHSDSAQNGGHAEHVLRYLYNFFLHLFSIFTYATLMTLLDFRIMLVIVIVSGVSFFTTRWESRYYESHKEQWEKENRKKGYLSDLSLDFSKAKDIKLYGMQGWIDKLLCKYQDFLLMWKKRCSLRGFWAATLSAMMTLLQNSVAYFVLIAMLLAGELTVGDFVFYFGLVASIAGFLQSIIGDVAKLITSADKIQYYREFFDYKDHFNHGTGCPIPEKHQSVTIEFRNVHYRYEGATEDTLNGINLTISAGEKLALVGINGAGKTTLVKLLCGFLIPTEGEILINGKPIAAYNIDDYYSMISAVFQDIHIVALTIYQFVASFDPDAPDSRERALVALRTAGLGEKIDSLPEGMDTYLRKGIYPNAIDLSGGEQQKLMLARAIYKDGSILILDEPTAALDPIAENELYLKYHTLTENKTSVYISHRFASTRFCDRIVLLENGSITECGSHDELMAKNGSYAHMFEVQSQYYKEEKYA